jgi:hypothetical protein
MSDELRTLEDFRRAVADGSLIVVTDSATGTQIHRADCPSITEAAFEKKVGRYFVVAGERDARRFPGARLCNICA